MAPIAPAVQDDLSAQLDAAREATREAEEKLGAATVDNKGVAAAEKALAEARAAETRLEAAIAESGRRGDVAAQEQAETEAANRRREAYAGAIARLEAALEVAQIRDSLIAANDKLAATPIPPKIQSAHEGFRNRPGSSPHNSDLDTALLDGFPMPPAFDVDRQAVSLEIGKSVSADQIRSLLEIARGRLREEEEGKGRDLSVSDEEWNERRRAEKRALAEARREVREAEASAEV